MAMNIETSDEEEEEEILPRIRFTVRPAYKKGSGPPLIPPSLGLQTTPAKWTIQSRRVDEELKPHFTIVSIAGNGNAETKEVIFKKILDYVSPKHLEDFEICRRDLQLRKRWQQDAQLLNAADEVFEARRRAIRLGLDGTSDEVSHNAATSTGAGNVTPTGSQALYKIDLSGLKPPSAPLAAPVATLDEEPDEDSDIKEASPPSLKRKSSIVADEGGSDLYDDMSHRREYESNVTYSQPSLSTPVARSPASHRKVMVSSPALIMNARLRNPLSRNDFSPGLSLASSTISKSMVHTISEAIHTQALPPKEEEEYAVKRIRSHDSTIMDGKQTTRYLVEWVCDYPGQWDPSWEVETNISSEALAKYWKAIRKDSSKQTSSRAQGFTSASPRAIRPGDTVPIRPGDRMGSNGVVTNHQHKNGNRKRIEVVKGKLSSQGTSSTSSTVMATLEDRLNGTMNTKQTTSTKMSMSRPGSIMSFFAREADKRRALDSNYDGAEDDYSPSQQLLKQPV